MKIAWNVTFGFIFLFLITTGVQAHASLNQTSSAYAEDLSKKNIVLTNSTTAQKILPPLKQFDEGVPPLAVVCNPDFRLVLKASDGTPACVKPSSIEKLVERGWAQSQAWEVHD